jgi:glycosyltransferase involved in cell wall biosynthesis
MDQKNKKISVLIITRNRRDFLDRCLMCLYETSTSEERHIYVWDNASEDDTPDYLATLKNWPDITIFRSEKNIGMEGRWKMIKMINSPYLLTLDDDAFITTKGWANLTKCFEADEKLGAICFSRATDERNNFGVTWEGVDYNSLSKPRFFSENMVNVFKGVPEPPDEKHRNLMKNLDGHWILPENKEINILFGGFCTLWRTDIVKRKKWQGKYGIMTDMAAEYRYVTEMYGLYVSITIEYVAYHACGCWWHMMCHGELSWADKVRESPIIYNRPGSEQQKWLDQCKEWSGWGSGI